MRHGRAASARASQVLVGRSEELDVLDRAFQRAAVEQAQVAVVEGEPGMGKSVLLETFVADHAPAASVRWLRCDAFERTVAYGAAGRLLDDDGLSNGSTVGIGRRLIATLGELGSDAESVAILAVDDAQWMDQPSAAALRFAVRRLRADRILCVVTKRPDRDAVELRTEDPRATTVLRLGPLDSSAVISFASQVRGLEVPGALADRLVARTGGLPLLVAAVVRDAHTVADLELDADVPASAASAVGRMLATVDASTRRLVEAAAVMNAPTDLAVLGRIAEVADPSEALSAATSTGLAVVQSTGAVECAHALLGDAIRQELTPAARRELHARAAAWCTGDRRLAHRAAAADRPDAELAAELRCAADVAHRAQQYELAANHRLGARSVSDDPAVRDRLLFEALIDRVDAQDLAGAERLAVLARDTAPHPRRSLALGLLAREKGEVGPARTLLRDAMDGAEAEADPSIPARAALAIAVLDVRVGDGAEAVDLLRDASPRDPESAADALTTMGIGLWQVGEIDQAVSLLDGVALSPGGHGWEADLLAARGMVSMYAGQPHRALDDLDRAIALVHLWRPSTNQSRTYVLRSTARYVLGDWDGAAVDAAAARTLAEGLSERWSLALALAVSIDVAAGRGQWEVAEDYLHRAVEASPGVQNVTDRIARHAAVLATARADHQGVLDALDWVWSDAYIEREARNRALRPVMQARVVACISVGRSADAQEDLARYEELLRRWPRGIVPAGWAGSGASSPRRGVSRLRRSASMRATSPTRPCLSSLPARPAAAQLWAARAGAREPPRSGGPPDSGEGLLRCPAGRSLPATLQHRPARLRAAIPRRGPVGPDPA